MVGYGFSTSLNLSQQQKLSPQMLQSINILALPVEELRERIFEEVEKNPALEIVNDRYYASAKDSDTHQAFLESISTEEKSLQEYLLLQLSEISLTPLQNDIGKLLIQSIDSQGFFQVPLDNLIKAFSQTYKNIDTKTVQQNFDVVLKIIQNFDPVGICCSNKLKILVTFSN